MAKAKSILDILRSASRFDGWEGWSIRTHVADYLTDAELDGLWWDSGTYEGCGCYLNDLMPCGHPHLEDCRVGVQKPCPDTGLCIPGTCPNPGDKHCGIGPKEETHDA